MTESEHKFRIGARVYVKGNSRKKWTIRTLSSGWNPTMVYVKFGNTSMWISEEDLVPVHFNPSVR